MSRENVLNELKNYTTVMFGTIGPDGNFDFRPMAIAECEKDCFYFITSRSSGKVSGIKDNDKVILIAQSNTSFLSIKGKGDISLDSDLLSEMWNPSFQTWFPDGPKNPDVCLVKFTPTAGEIWDNGLLNKAKYIWEVVSSNVTGKKAEMQDTHDSF